MPKKYHGYGAGTVKAYGAKKVGLGNRALDGMLSSDFFSLW